MQSQYSSAFRVHLKGLQNAATDTKLHASKNVYFVCMYKNVHTRTSLHAYEYAVLAMKAIHRQTKKARSEIYKLYGNDFTCAYSRTEEINLFCVYLTQSVASFVTELCAAATSRRSTHLTTRALRHLRERVFHDCSALTGGLHVQR